MKTNDQVLVESLEIVNKAREACGLKPLSELPPGLTSSPLHCPLANALPDEAFVNFREIRFSDEAAARALTKAIGSSVRYDESVEPYVSDRKQRAMRRRPWRVISRSSSLFEFVARFDGGEFKHLRKRRLADVSKV